MTVIICNYFRNAYTRIEVMKIAKKNLIAIGGLGFILSGAMQQLANRGDIIMVWRMLKKRSERG